MKKEKPTTKICKHCKTEIAYDAKVCPQCRKKQGGKLKWIIIAVVLFAFLGALGGGEEDNALQNNTDTTSEITNNNNEETTTENDVDQKENEKLFEYGDMKVEFLEYKIEEDAAGTQCLVLYFNFTNNEDDSYAFGYTFDVNVFQDGVELEPTYFHVNDETENGDKEIKTGVTLTVAEQFELKEVSGNIEIEIEPFNIWSDRTLFEYEFSLD